MAIEIEIVNLNQWVRREILHFLMREDIEYQKNYISQIETDEYMNTVTIDITTSFPGMLIGKAGRIIDKLKHELSEELNREVILKLKENKTWFNLYD